MSCQPCEAESTDASQGHEVPVVNEFSDVLSKELSVKASDHDIEFVIE
jgi:hypothetical protein